MKIRTVPTEKKVVTIPTAQIQVAEKVEVVTPKIDKAEEVLSPPAATVTPVLPPLAPTENNAHEIIRLIENSTQDVPTFDLSGEAGTGKTTLIRKLVAQNPSFGVLVATTGIAAVNIGGTTIHSLLNFSNWDVLYTKWTRGFLHARLREIRRVYKTIICDEKSMFAARGLDYLYNAISEVNDDGERTLGFGLCGDFAQLPPVKEEFCFKSNCWKEFADHSIKLTKIWRQDNETFIRGINAIRMGKQKEAVDLLTASGVTFTSMLDDRFEGTTIVATNDEADRYNLMRLGALQGDRIQIMSERKGKLLGEWKEIPEIAYFKTGAYVMLLANNRLADKEQGYANGDCGHIESFNAETKTFQIRLVRTGQVVSVGLVTRTNTLPHEPTEKDFTKYDNVKYGMLGIAEEVEGYKVNVDKDGFYNIGEITYAPLRLAYACTCHKSQGLSLDKVQFDIRHGFVSRTPALTYVGVSRAKTPQGLTIVGTPIMLASKIKTDREVMRWI